MTSTNIATSSPPPTTNKLDAAQRARLMRSSRKIGAVLGTTPFSLESCAGTTHHHSTRRDIHAKRRHRHRERASSISETSPLISLSAISTSSDEPLLHKSDTSTEELLAPRVSTSSQRDRTPRPLFLRLDTVLLSSSDPPLSPLSPNTDDVPPTPPTPIELSRTETRRRKMARVVRTLGENVPPELVFQPSSDDTELSEKVSLLPSPIPHDARSGAPRTRPSVKLTRPRSRSVAGPSSRWQRLVDLPAPVFSSSTRAPADQHWVGAWNRKNIGQVQRELRSLRQR
jgi:hypothetical protein